MFKQPSEDKLKIIDRQKHFEMIDRELRKQKRRNFFCDAFYIKKTWSIQDVTKIEQPKHYQSLFLKVFKLYFPNLKLKTCFKLGALGLFGSLAYWRFCWKGPQFSSNMFSPEKEEVFSQALAIENELLGYLEDVYKFKEDYALLEAKYSDNLSFSKFNESSTLFYTNGALYFFINWAVAIGYSVIQKFRKKKTLKSSLLRGLILFFTFQELLEYTGFFDYSKVRDEISQASLSEKDKVMPEDLVRFSFYRLNTKV